MRGCVRPGGEVGGQGGTPSAGCSGARDLGLPQPERWTASRLVPVQLPGAQQAEAFVRAFLKRSMPRMNQQACEDQLQRKAVVLEYFTRRKRKEKRKRSKGLSARQRRELHLFDITAEQQRYNLFLPLHELWKQYIRDLCGGLKPDTQPQMIQAKLLKADLHGALISVTKSKCPSYVGVTGILLQETKHVFKIITKEDRLKGVRERGQQPRPDGIAGGAVWCACSHGGPCPWLGRPCPEAAAPEGGA
uniref:Ribonuclease P protein subunit p29 n=1 Tax=Canis lupus familiaris TaxID=9615 RepID=A0A8C0Q8Q1_CANLF